MTKSIKQYAVYNPSENYYDYYDSLQDAVTTHYCTYDLEPVEVFECAMKSIGEYAVERSVKVKKIKSKGKK